jgi:hypothetical protein
MKLFGQRTKEDPIRHQNTGVVDSATESDLGSNPIKENMSTQEVVNIIVEDLLKVTKDSLRLTI